MSISVRLWVVAWTAGLLVLIVGLAAHQILTQQGTLGFADCDVGGRDWAWLFAFMTGQAYVLTIVGAEKWLRYRLNWPEFISTKFELGILSFLLGFNLEDRRCTYVLVEQQAEQVGNENRNNDHS